MKRKINIFISKILCIFKKNIILGKDSYIDLGSKILGTQVLIGDHNGIKKIYVVGGQPLIIGKYCAIAGNLTVITSNHILNKPNIQAFFQNKFFNDSMDDQSKGPVIIGNNVWIGLNVTILPGVKIGDGAVIGAGSVVSKSVDPFAIVVGNPAKTIKKRFSEKTILKIISNPWWNWSQEKIIKSKKYFITKLK